MDAITAFTTDGLASAKAADQLFVTLTYAQSLDGSIAATRGQPTILSGAASMAMTHQLRAMHDGILVGIGTVLADNPSLTVRLVEGKNPQPLIVDGDLICPLTCKLFTHPTCTKPWLLTVDDGWSKDKLARKAALEAAGAIVILCAASSTRRVHLEDAFRRVHARGIASVMVEGGASILTSCLAAQATNCRVLSHGIVTIAPIFIGGLHGVTTLLPAYPRLHPVQMAPFGNDIVMFGPFVPPQ
ncbi:hypothetical protein, variant [Aphanomyces invadans]|uniref:Bacterial bifunctional deaminase-reductase C-terminal domain-containing protein n=1 Tax=Aphanomyces invadans TaxID=157072 RepID=A0A024U0V2_9STRA|nr:hypothetical protein H310_07482 [Aphanomyces invadans]XP_008871076.1 hypothetical protein, variant [Aphanomyces invadans]ETW00050.1 hypothetical protein H310_07482 [Aphanomyces invadans]ETW00051.1 hypothetical protein, variant [Aphanomyces invadans]|eukprot:XP_008871075.1 hypothetical protein H310_07482 [Aphanomyces invadans]